MITTETIKEYGWVDTGKGHTFKKQNCEYLVQLTGKLRVFKPSLKNIGSFEREIYYGDCPTIQDFEFLIKLLEI